MRPSSVEWTDVATRHYFELYKEALDQQEQLQFTKRIDIYQYIRDKMSDLGYEISTEQVENKFKSLHRAYRIAKMKRTGSKKSRDVAMFFNEMQEVFTRQPKLLKVERVIPRPRMRRCSRKPKETKSTKKVRAMRESLDQLTSKIDEDLQVKKELLKELRLVHKKANNLLTNANEQRKRKNDLLEKFLAKYVEL